MIRRMRPNKTYTTSHPIKRIFNALKYSIKGISAAFKSEAAFRQDCLLVLVNCVALYWVHDKYFFVWLFFSGLFVLFAELINTALEYIVDLITQEHHPLAGSAKDIGSALVFLAIVNLVLSWAVFLYRL